MVSLRAEVRASLLRHGVEPAEGATPETLRERLNDVYLEDVRRLKERQRAGEIALGDYAAAAEGLADAVDVFCEHLAFSPAQCERVFRRAAELARIARVAS